VLGILKPTLQGEYGWTEIDYGWIVFSFQTAYAIGLLFVGWFMDKVGTKKGFALSITVWSLAAMAHAWVVPIGTAACRCAQLVRIYFDVDCVYIRSRIHHRSVLAWIGRGW
jgi:ACS family hexuronate transporter-like MFS transporter